MTCGRRWLLHFGKQSTHSVGVPIYFKRRTKTTRKHQKFATHTRSMYPFELEMSVEPYSLFWHQTQQRRSKNNENHIVSLICFRSILSFWSSLTPLFIRTLQYCRILVHSFICVKHNAASIRDHWQIRLIWVGEFTQHYIYYLNTQTFVRLLASSAHRYAVCWARKRWLEAHNRMCEHTSDPLENENAFEE